MAEQQSSSEQVHAEFYPEQIETISSEMIHAEFYPEQIRTVSSILLMVEFIPSYQVTKRRWQVV